jgi:predicted GH43/DUF377 family glycosyl hydrolase
MKKTIYVFVCLLFLYFTSFNTVDATNWVKEGPVSFTNSSTWNSHFNRTPTVIFQENKYLMWFDGYDGNYFKIGFATSEDGKTWDNLSSPVLNGSTFNKHYLEPFVLYESNEYKMWFLAIDKQTNKTSIMYSTSQDGKIWSEPTVNLSPTQEWEINHLAHPHVIKQENKYIMYYNGETGDGAWKIGYAISDDGINWQKYDSNPIFTADPNEAPTVAGPFIFKNNNKYEMYYHSLNPAKNINFAVSTDGINWERKENVLTTSQGEFDSVSMISPFLVKTNDEYKLFYSGFNGNKWSIGYASKEIEKNEVPLLKQTSNPWQDDIYDRANLWSPSNMSINRWGCAVTSATMVLQHHGYTKLPNNTPLDPGTLNTWLNSQRDGYVGTGLVNWHAISRLSKQARDINGITEFEALEFERTGKNNALLDSDLEKNNPAILMQPGHFVVATNKLSNTYEINDPFFDRDTIANGYGNTYQALYRYIPSNTDLSTLLIVHPTAYTLEVRDSQNNIVSESYIQTPISAADQPSLKAGGDVKVLTVKKPSSGIYTLTYKSSTTEIVNISLFLYDKNGEVIESKIEGFAHPANNAYEIVFNKDDNTKTYIKKVVTFNSILKDLDAAYKNKQIHLAYYNNLKQLMLEAQKDNTRKNALSSKIRLFAAIQITSFPSEILISKDYSKILNSDLKMLHSTL